MRTKLLLLILIPLFFVFKAKSQNIVITEIMYNDPSSGATGDSLEYIEFYNNGLTSIDLTGYQLTTPGSTTAVTFTFPTIIMSPGGYVIVAKKSTAIQSFFGVSGVLQWTAGNLTNGINSIVLKTSLNVTVDSVRYNISAPWPTAANGLGSSLMLCNPGLDNNVGSNWVASSPLNATTYGLLNTVYVYASPMAGCNTTAAYIPVFATVPYTENFDNVWVQGDWLRDVPNNHWKNNPSSGNSSWRRNDDGQSAAWTNPTTGAYNPAGAGGTSTSARFHSVSATAGTTGTFDLYLDFSTTGSKRLKFWYMNTVGTDSLAIYMSVDSGLTFTYLQKFITVSSTIWEQKQIELGNSQSSHVILRFKASSTNTSGATDIGLDGVDISLVPNNDIGISAITKPTSPVVTATDTVKVTFKNYGANVITSAILNWSVNGVLQTPYSWGGNLASLASTAEIALGPFNFSGGGYFNIKAWTSQPNGFTDPDHTNDTLTKSVYYQTYAPLPFLDQMENTWISKQGTHDISGFYWLGTPATGNNSWRREDDGASAAWTNATTGAYIPTGANNTTHSARFHSAAATIGSSGTYDLYLDFTTPGFKRAKFWYMNTSGTDSLVVYIANDSTQTFSFLQKFTTVTSSWELKLIDLGNSTSHKVTLRFKAFATGTSGTTDIGIDEVNVFLIPNNDAGITAITQPLPIMANLTDTVKVSLHNFGGNNLTSTWINWSVDGIVQTPYLWSGNLSNSSTASNINLGPHTFAGTGFSLIKVWTSQPNNSTDPDATNDTLTKSVYYQPYATIPYIEHMDSTWVNKYGTHDVPSQYWKNAVTTGSNSWRRDDDGASAAWTNPTVGAYTPAGGNATIHSARFHTGGSTGGTIGMLDFYVDFSTPGLKRLKFWHMNTAGADSMAVYMSLDGGQTFNFVQRFSNNPATWEFLQQDLTTSTSPTAVLRFKVTTNTNGNTDVGLDEVQVEIVAPNDIGITAISQPPTGLTSLTDTVKVTLKNFGGNNVTSATLNWAVNGVIQTPAPWTGNLAPTATQTSVQVGVFTFLATGLNTIKVWTSLPNGATDPDHTNDTLTKSVYFQPYAPIPFIEHFDSLWVNKLGTRDVPDFYWVTTPATGSPSWRRADDGVSAGWTNAATGAFTPSGANGTVQSARFHTAGNASGVQGVMDLFLDFTTPGTKELRFRQYNFDGTDSLAIWMSVDAGATFTYLAKFTTAATWTPRAVLLGNSTSSHVVLRFRATANNGGTTDIGIDEVSVKLAVPDLGVIALVSPVSGCGLGSNEFVTVKVKNFGFIAVTHCDVSFNFSGTPTTETVSSTILPGDTITFTFLQHANLILPGPHPGKVYTSFPTDGDNTNDTLAKTIINIGVINTFPFTENFQAGSTNYFLLTGATNATATLGPAFGSGYGWGVRLSGGVASTWPSGSGATTTPAQAWSYTDHLSKVATCMVDANLLLHPELRIDLRQFYMTTGGPKYSYFRVLINDTVQVSDVNGNSNFNPVTDTNDAWVTHVFNLAAYGHSQFKVTLEASEKYAPGGTNGAGDCSFIDNIIIREKPANDMAVTAITAPVTGCGLGTAPATIVIKNNGLVAATNFTVQVKLDAGAFITEPITVTILPDSSYTYTFTAPLNISAFGPHLITAVVNLAGDANALNDTVKKTVTNMGVISTFPFLEDFESGSTYYFSLVGAANAAAYIQAAAGNNNTYGLRMNGNVANTWGSGTGNSTTAAQAWGFTDHVSSAYTCLVNGTSLVHPELKLDLRQIYISGGGPKYSWFKVMINDTVQIADGTGANVFNPVTQAGDPFTTRVFDLAAYAGTHFKVTLMASCKYGPGTGNGEGDDVYVDNFIIMEKPANDIGVTSFISPSTGCALTSTYVSVKLRNFGINPASNFPMWIKLDAGTWTSAIFSFTIAPDSTMTFIFPTPLNLAAYGYHTITVVSALPGDGNSLNDTLKTTLYNSPYINTYPYFQDFESTSVNGWRSDFITGMNEWVWGTPAKTNINTAHSGTKAWVTGLTGTYHINTNSYLMSPCFDFSFLNNPFISVWLNFRTEVNYDAMILEVSVNDSTWYKIGDTSFYNNTSNQPPVSPPKWSGTSNGWKEYFILQPNLANKHKVVFRFRFQSDNTNVDEGVAVDDFLIMEGVPDLAVTSMNTPVSSCSLASHEAVNITVKNPGPVPVYGIPLMYSINNGLNWTYDTLHSTLNHNQSINFTFTVAANFGPAGVYPCIALVSIPGDASHLNDTVREEIVHMLPITVLPFLETFEGANMYFAINHSTNSNLVVAPGFGFLGTRCLQYMGGSKTTWPDSSNTTAAHAWGYTDHIATARSCNVQLPPVNELWLTLHLKQVSIFSYQVCSWFRVLINDTTQVADTNNFMNFNPVTLSNDVFVNRVFNLNSFIGTNFTISMQSSCRTTGDQVFVDNVRLYDPTTIGIQKVNQDIGFVVYPNPGHDMIWINFNSQVENAELSLVNELGQVIMSRKLEPTLLESVNIASLPPGVYGVILKCNGKTGMRKIVKY